VSIKLVIQGLMQDLSSATANTEKARSKLLKMLDARGETESSFSEKMTAQSTRMADARENALLCVHALKMCSRDAFGKWIAAARAAGQKHEEIRMLEEKEREEREKQEVPQFRRARSVNREQEAPDRRHPGLLLPEVLLACIDLLLHSPSSSTEEEPDMVLQGLQHLDVDHITPEDGEFLAPFLESEAFAERPARLRDVTESVLSLPSTHEHYVEIVLCNLVGAFRMFASAKHERECADRKSHQHQAVAVVAGPRGGAKLRRTRSSDKARGASPLRRGGMGGEAEVDSRVRLVTENRQDKYLLSSNYSDAKHSTQVGAGTVAQGSKEQDLESDSDEILKLRTEVRVLEQCMRQIQQRLDDAYARKIKIMAEVCVCVCV
jgi:hypothetical protein